MARVYYSENKLSGRPFTGNSVTIEVFNEILSKVNPPRNQFERLELTYKGNPTFRTVIIWKGDFYYNYNGQNIYLPDAIILGDDFTLPYPDEYYFVARIGQHLDVRKIEGGEGFTWDQTIDASMPHPTDEAFLNKLEHSFLTLKRQVQEVIKHDEQVKSELRAIDKVKVQACTTLATLCEWEANECAHLGNFLAAQKVEDDDPYTILSIIEDYCYAKKEKRKLIFMYFDWKEHLREFEWKLSDVLKNNYKIAENIPIGRFPPETQIFESGVQYHFDSFLRIYDLQLTQVKTEGDDYLFVVHRTSYYQAVKRNINILGWGTSGVQSYGWILKDNG